MFWNNQLQKEPLIGNVQNKSSSKWKIFLVFAVSLALLGVLQREGAEHSEVKVAGFIPLSGAAPVTGYTEHKRLILCFFSDREGDTWMRSKCTWVAHRFANVAKTTVETYPLSQFQTQMRKSRSGETYERYVVFLAAHGTSGGGRLVTGEFAKTPIQTGMTPITKEAVPLQKQFSSSFIAIGDDPQLGYDDIYTEFATFRLNTRKPSLFITSACYSSYLTQKEEYGSNPFPLITTGRFTEGIASTNSGFTTWAASLDPLIKELGFDLARFLGIRDSPDVIASLKLKATRMVTDVPTKTLQWASGFTVAGHDGTFDWMFTSPDATTLANFGMDPEFFYVSWKMNTWSKLRCELGDYKIFGFKGLDKWGLEGKDVTGAFYEINLNPDPKSIYPTHPFTDVTFTPIPDCTCSKFESGSQAGDIMCGFGDNCARQTGTSCPKGVECVKPGEKKWHLTITWDTENCQDTDYAIFKVRWPITEWIGKSIAEAKDIVEEANASMTGVLAIARWNHRRKQLKRAAKIRQMRGIMTDEQRRLYDEVIEAERQKILKEGTESFGKILVGPLFLRKGQNVRLKDIDSTWNGKTVKVDSWNPAMFSLIFDGTYTVYSDELSQTKKVKTTKIEKIDEHTAFN